MVLLSKLLGAIVTPIRTLFFWVGQMIPGFKNLPKLTLPGRVGIMMFFALFVVLIVGITQIFLTETEARYRDPWFVLLISLPFLFAIPYGCYLLVKLLLTKDVSRYPELDRAWDRGLLALENAQIRLQYSPLFLVVGGSDFRQTDNLIKAAQLGQAVHEPAGEDSPLQWYSDGESVFLFLNRASCLSKVAQKLQQTPSAGPVMGATPGGGGGSGTGTLAAGMAIGPISTPGMPVGSQTLDSGSPPVTPMANPLLPPGAGGGGGGATMQLPMGQDPASFLPQPPVGSTAVVPVNIGLSPQEANDLVDRLEYVCRLLKKTRQAVCPVNGLLALVPFSAIGHSGADVQAAAQKDLAVIRQNLRVRCAATLLVTGMEEEEGFQELVNRVDPANTQNNRFGKGCDPWGDSNGRRLRAVGDHAAGAFEVWTHSLFQQENALKRRYNSRLFALLCKVRGGFSESLQNVLSYGFGYDPEQESELADRQFLFSGCYFAATGTNPDQQAFVSSVFRKVMEQDEAVEWAPEAWVEDSRFQLAANLFALTGLAALAAIAAMAVYLNTDWFRPE
jgi:hypothetical protein